MPLRDGELWLVAGQCGPAPGGLSLAATWDGPIRHVVPTWDDEFERLFVRERRGERALVVWPGELDVLVGWVANEELDTRQPASVGSTRCGGGFGILGVKARERRRCSAPLVVSVAFEGARWRAGRIMAGTTVSVIDQKGADAVVGVHGAAITLAKGATLLASSADLEACPLLP